MKVAVSTIGKFHTFDLARELHRQDALAAIFTGYPRFKLKHEQLPGRLIKTYPWIHTPYMIPRLRNALGTRAIRTWELLDRASLDRHVSRNLPPCEVFVGLSGSALRSGRIAHSRGARYVCDRGSTHIRTQERLQREEHERWDMPYDPIDPRIMEIEQEEYAEADCVTVPSTFALRSFVAEGVPAAKLRHLPYGVNLTRFHPAGAPDPSRFDVLFVGGMSLRKGVQYLVQAYQRIQHPRLSITFAGIPDPDLIAMLRGRGLWPEQARVIGHVPQPQLKELMSRSHVLVLPSVEEGLALVLAQAMACGCPVVATENTGAGDLLEDGVGGFILPIRDVDQLAERLQRLADQPALRDALSEAATARVRALGGWSDYGDRAMKIYSDLAGHGTRTA
jgi:starch synthase